MEKVEKNKKVIIIAAAVGAVLLVVACICAIIFAISTLGISKAQQNARDLKRRSFIADINVGLVDYQSQGNQVPTSIFKNKNSVQFGFHLFTLIDELEADSKTTSKSTAYCYRRVGKNYALGVKQENGEWYNIGLEKCSDSDIILF